MTAFSLFSLIGQKALVTGAAQGIGKASAFALATAGADVAIIDHNSEAGEKTAKAHSRPIPIEPPVTNTFLPLRSKRLRSSIKNFSCNRKIEK